MLAAIIGCFWGGIHASKKSASQDFFYAIRVLGFLYLSAIPLFISSVILGCLTIDGLGFWIFIPLPSVFFGTATGRLIRKFSLPWPKLLTVFVLLFCAIGVWLFEMLNYPQVYFYNHVWGVWPGPIYDEAVQLTGSFFYFRWLTFLWILLLWLLPDWSSTLQKKLITGLALVSLLFSYMNLDEAGIISPRESIQAQLGGHHQTKHFDYYFPEDFYSEEEINFWAARHEFHFEQIIKQLDLKWPKGRKIESYLYAHAWQKKEITGAKFTSYVPIWLEQDQLHIAKQQLDGVLKHELVHVISKQFGNGLFNGSWSIGLIEGLAEGIAKDASSRSTLHQIVAAESPYPSSDKMKDALSFSGFYGSAGAISYTTAGSFVEYLLDTYPPDFFKTSYPSGSLVDSNYPSFDEIISEWHQTLDQTPLDSVDQQVSEFVFAQRSLFQKKCPHSITQELQLWDRYQFQLADLDTTGAYETLDQLYKRDSQNSLVKDAWVRSQLLQGNYEEATNAITPKDSLLTLQVLKADALYLSDNKSQAFQLLESLSSRIIDNPARTFRYTLELREDSTQWSNRLQRRYLNQLPDSVLFESLNLPNQMLSLNKALQGNHNSEIVLYATLLQDHSPKDDWFDIYEQTIQQLPLLGYFDLTENWIALAEPLNLRLRYMERLGEQQEWVAFLKSNQGVAD
tara:strand:+ start:9053 stop:11092 length:2040 start_codon:yes stop_codon:yes gene_type:complete